MTSVALANGPTWKEEGAKVFHSAPHTYSKVVSKGVSLNGGTSVYRGGLSMLGRAPSMLSPP